MKLERALVYGGRRFNKRDVVFARLDEIHQLRPIGLVIHGACANSTDLLTGETIYSVDLLAEQWAQSTEVPYCGWPAKWKSGSLGAGEGPKRNQVMLDKTRPTLGIEFPGGKGTYDMRTRLQKAGILIYHYDRLI